MIIKSRYKIARRLGPQVFDKTQSPKFALREAQRGKQKDAKHPRQKTDFGLQMLEKQKARYTYGINERQFSKYIRECTADKEMKPVDGLFARLETRLDNTIYRLGFANSRSFARQMASHGHFTVNGKKVTIPSYRLSIGDKVAVRATSAKKTLFQGIDEKLKKTQVPSWLKFDLETKEATVQGVPKAEKHEIPFNATAIFEFYSR